MHCKPNPLALRVAFHLARTPGGFQRRSPTGGLAKGMPRKAVMVPADLPSSLPVSILTVGAEPAARMVIATANRAVKKTAPATAEKPSLIGESPGSPRDNITGLAGLRSSSVVKTQGTSVRDSSRARLSYGFHWQLRLLRHPTGGLLSLIAILLRFSVRFHRDVGTAPLRAHGTRRW